MIPLKDNVSTRTLPIITAGLVFVNLSVFLLQNILLPDQAGELIYRQYGFVPQEFLRALTGQWGLLPYNAATLVSSMFLHAGVLHLAGNMLYLWIFGKNIEDAMGHSRFAAFYLLSGALASLAQLFYDPSSTVPVIGASGAVSGTLGAYLVLYPFARIKTLLIILIFFKIVEIPAVLLLTVWFFMQVALSATTGGIAWHAHIGGFIFGLLSVKVLTKSGFAPNSTKRRVYTNP